MFIGRAGVNFVTIGFLVCLRFARQPIDELRIQSCDQQLCALRVVAVAKTI